jgi:DNA-binding NarL/FixJ family response regulator
LKSEDVVFEMVCPSKATCRVTKFLYASLERPAWKVVDAVVPADPPFFRLLSSKKICVDDGVLCCVVANQLETDVKRPQSQIAIIIIMISKVTMIIRRYHRVALLFTCLKALLMAVPGSSFSCQLISTGRKVTSNGWLVPTTLWMVGRIEEEIDDDDHDDEDDNNPKVDEFQFTSRDDPMWRKRSECWVIVVDDEEAIRKAVGQLLFDQGYQVTACADGPTALQVATTSKKRQASSGEGGEEDDAQTRRIPDCIVSDIRMPEMDGLELLQRIRADETTVEVPVILLTAKGMTQDRIAGYNAGADAYLPKPFDPDELVAIVDGVIERHEKLSGVNVQVDYLKRDLDEIKYLLLEKGGGGVGNGWVEETNIFLAPDEREILELLCEGLMTKEIAAKTYLSTRRVEQLLTRMFRKTGVKNRTELVRWAVKTGNVQL